MTSVSEFHDIIVSLSSKLHLLSERHNNTPLSRPLMFEFQPIRCSFCRLLEPRNPFNETHPFRSLGFRGRVPKQHGPFLERKFGWIYPNNNEWSMSIPSFGRNVQEHNTLLELSFNIKDGKCALPITLPKFQPHSKSLHTLFWAF